MRVLALALWRLAVAGVAVWALWLSLLDAPQSWRSFADWNCVAVAIGFFVLATWPMMHSGRSEPRSPWLRGQLTVSSVLVAWVYRYAHHGAVDTPAQVVPHVVLPLLVAFDYLALGSNQRRAHVVHPLAWLLLPGLYVGYCELFHDWAWSVLNPASVKFGPSMTYVGLGLVFVGFILYCYGLVRRALADDQREAVRRSARQTVRG